MKSRMLAVVLTGTALVAPAAYAATPFDGPYLGVQAGHSIYDIETTAKNPPAGESAKIEGISASGAEGGLYAGWGTKLTPTIYGGLEAEYSWSGEEHKTSMTDATGTGTLKIEEKYNYGLSARLGWMPSTTTMLYARAGWQRTNLDYSASLYGMSGSQNRDHDGLRLGAGAEVALTSDWLLRLDYAHTWYSDETFSAASGESVKFEPAHNVFRIGIARQF